MLGWTAGAALGSDPCPFAVKIPFAAERETVWAADEGIGPGHCPFAAKIPFAGERDDGAERRAQRPHWAIPVTCFISVWGPVEQWEKQRRDAGKITPDEGAKPMANPSLLRKLTL